jgi:hypothetical protein
MEHVSIEYHLFQGTVSGLSVWELPIRNHSAIPSHTSLGKPGWSAQLFVPCWTMIKECMQSFQCTEKTTLE